MWPLLVFFQNKEVAMTLNHQLAELQAKLKNKAVMETETTSTHASNQDLSIAEITGIALAKSRVRALVWALHFAKHEPKYCGQKLNWEPFHRAERLAREVCASTESLKLLAKYGWSRNDYGADFDTLLTKLPPFSDFAA
jgi:hypothetical protein